MISNGEPMLSAGPKYRRGHGRPVGSDRMGAFVECHGEGTSPSRAARRGCLVDCRTSSGLGG
jgi:hypothetical protein